MKALLCSYRCRQRSILFGLVCWVMASFLWSDTATAHRVIIFAWVDGDTIHTESKFSGGKRVNNGDVRVYDLTGNPLLSGRTDSEGMFSFTIPRKTGMKIAIEAGMGHRGEWTVPLSEIDPHETAPEPAETQKTGIPPSDKSAATPSLTPEQLRLILDQSLDRRLNPVLKMLAESRDPRPTLRDILGGIGYIFGLMGLAAYIHFRQKTAAITDKRNA